MFFSDDSRQKRRKADRQRRKRQDEQRRKDKVRRRTKPVAGLIAGLIGGVVATWVLDNYQRGAAAAARDGKGDPAEASAFHTSTSAAPVSTAPVPGEAEIGGAASHPFATPPSRPVLPVGPAVLSLPLLSEKPRVRYLTGAVAGAIYGIGVELVPFTKTGYGTGFASLLFLGGPDVLAPFLPPGVQPPAPAGVKKDALPGGLSAHLVFGGALETVRRVLRWVF